MSVQEIHYRLAYGAPVPVAMIQKLVNDYRSLHHAYCNKEHDLGKLLRQANDLADGKVQSHILNALSVLEDQEIEIHEDLAIEHTIEQQQITREAIGLSQESRADTA